MLHYGLPVKRAGLFIGGYMNKKDVKNTTMPQEKKASMYMVMGVMLEVVTFMWSIKSLVPNAAFIIVAIIGVVPVLKMSKSNYSEPTDKEKLYWNKAVHNSGKFIFALLIYYWIFTCIDRVIDLPISADVCYMVPYLVGIAFLFTGHYFKLYKFMEDQENDE